MNLSNHLNLMVYNNHLYMDTHHYSNTYAFKYHKLNNYFVTNHHKFYTLYDNLLYNKKKYPHTNLFIRNSLISINIIYWLISTGLSPYDMLNNQCNLVHYIFYTNNGNLEAIFYNYLSIMEINYHNNLTYIHIEPKQVS